MSSMQRTIRWVILRSRNGGKTYHYRSCDGGEHDRAPRVIKAERRGKAEQRVRWPCGRKREAKGRMPVPEAVTVRGTDERRKGT